MNSKFTQIAKVRKQQRDVVETRLAKARFEKQEIKKKITRVCREIDDTKIPKKGTISLMNMNRESLSIIRKERDFLQEKLIVKDNEISQLRDKYKRAHVEYEKIKYLEEQDFQEHIKKMKKKESLDLDEISNMLFVNKGKK